MKPFKKSRKWNLIPIPSNNLLNLFFPFLNWNIKLQNFILVLILHLTRILIRIMQCDIPITLYLAINFILIRTSTFILFLVMPFQFTIHSFLNLESWWWCCSQCSKSVRVSFIFPSITYSLNYHASTLS